MDMAMQTGLSNQRLTQGRIHVFGGKMETNDNGVPVAIGPVISGWENDEAVYYVDMVYADGSTKRLTWKKTVKGLDKKAKGDAVFARMKLAEQYRQNDVVLIHDLVSFDNLRTWVSRLAAKA